MLAEPFELDGDLVVVGWAIRTSAQTASADIPALWQRFSPDPTSPDVYAVYCDYETDARSAYTMVLGTAVDQSREVRSEQPERHAQWAMRTRTSVRRSSTRVAPEFR